MKTLCLIYNFAPKYREGIFKLIDDEYNCHWYFGQNNTDIKGLDINILHNVSLLKTIRIPFTPFYFQCGVVKLLWRKDYSTFFILGELYCLSTWMLLICNNVFRQHKAIYLWTHGWYGKESYVRRILKKLFFHFANGIFLYGNYAKKLMVNEGFDGNKLFVIHNSLMHSKQLAIRGKLRTSNIYSNHFGNTNQNLIFIGRLTAVKHIDELICAMKLLCMHGYYYNLTVVGDGEMRRQLEILVQEKGLSDSVWFYGSCYDDNVNAELIYNADLCVSPGNVGLTAIHAMTFGCPVVTHHDFPHQMPEFEAIRDGVTGTFFERGNVESLASAIVRWHSIHNDDRETVRQACFNEIDIQWTPEWQINVIKENLKM